MEIRIIKDNEIPAYTQISTHIHTLAQEGRLKPGTKLPSERELACTLSLSRGTVKKAYETLSEMGVIQISKKKRRVHCKVC